MGPYCRALFDLLLKAVEAREQRVDGRIKEKSPKFKFGILRLFLHLFYTETFSDIFVAPVRCVRTPSFSVRCYEINNRTRVV